MPSHSPEGLTQPAAVEAPDRLRMLQRWALALLLVGIVWRLTRYLLRFPIWGDECFNCLNLVGNDYLGLTEPLRYRQVAPLVFWWGELTAYRILGPSELAMRLLPFLAGLGGLLLFWRLAHLALPPLARTLAIGFLAVAIWPVSMASLIKPYSLDLFASTALLVLAVQWLQRPDRVRWLALLALAVPLALFSSFPVVFVAGSIGVALLPAVWRQPGWKAKALFVVYNLLLVGGFLGSYLLGQKALGPPDDPIRQFLRDYWADGFPPASPRAFLEWLVLIHTGRLMAYPLGGSAGQSTVTFLLFLVGLWQMWHGRRRALLVVCVGPFVVGLVAAALRAYPYGGCCRLSQHVAPIVCLLAGSGAATLIECVRSETARQRWAVGACCLLALVGLGGAARDVVRPYRAESDRWMRQVGQELVARSAPEDHVVVLNAQESTDVVWQWQLAQFPGRVSWNGELDENALNAKGQVWGLNVNGAGSGLERIRERMARQNRGAAEHVSYVLGANNQMERERLTIGAPGAEQARERHPGAAPCCDVYRWGGAGSAAVGQR